jgi:glycerol-3-phosphate dehydrogenase
VATAAEQGATLLNYAKVTGLRKNSTGLLEGLIWQDMETGEGFELEAKVIVNATGPFIDSVRNLSEPDAEPIIAPSQGAHIVLDRSFLPGKNAILVPHTSDGRVMFAIPWHEHTLIGTTDTPISDVSLEPSAFDEEVEFMLETASRYLARRPTRADILSTFAGIRPLVKAGRGSNTAALSRDHTIHIDKSGLVNIGGGKWTTYRNMAQDCVDQAATLGDLPDRDCRTRTLNIHGFHTNAANFGSLSFYGADAPAIRSLAGETPEWSRGLDEQLPYIEAEYVWAAREEMARTVEDALARRTRALFLNAHAALRMAPRVAAILAEELGKDQAWQTDQIEKFGQVASGFIARS